MTAVTTSSSPFSSSRSPPSNPVVQESDKRAEPVILPPYLVNTHELYEKLSRSFGENQSQVLTQSMLVLTQEK